jgi:hypothetical protein
MKSYKNCVDVTPDDDNDLSNPADIFVGVSGNVTVIPMGGSTPVTFTSFPANSILPVRVKRVLSTGTGASGLKALWGIP